MILFLGWPKKIVECIVFYHSKSHLKHVKIFRKILVYFSLKIRPSSNTFSNDFDVSRKTLLVLILLFFIFKSIKRFNFLFLVWNDNILCLCCSLGIRFNKTNVKLAPIILAILVSSGFNTFIKTFINFIYYRLTLSWRRPLSYRNQSIDLLCKSMDWFLYDNDRRLERVKVDDMIITWFKYQLMRRYWVQKDI